MTDTRSVLLQLLSFPHLSSSVRLQMKKYLRENNALTKKEGNPHHVNVFFLPYNQREQMIYLGHHKKADDWIPPGGHIEPGETPVEAVIREMQEELLTAITVDQIQLFNLSIKPIGRGEQGCLTHYDIWYLIHIPVTDFSYDAREFHAAGWFTIPAGLKKITKNPDFAKIIRKLSDA